jgi:hypothetical protein
VDDLRSKLNETREQIAAEEKRAADEKARLTTLRRDLTVRASLEELDCTKVDEVMEIVRPDLSTSEDGEIVGRIEGDDAADLETYLDHLVERLPQLFKGAGGRRDSTSEAPADFYEEARSELGRIR